MLSFGKFKKYYRRHHKNSKSDYIVSKYAKGINLFFGTELDSVKKYRFYDDEHANINAVARDSRIECILVPRRQMSDNTIGTEDEVSFEYQRNPVNPNAFFRTPSSIPKKTYPEHVYDTYNLSDPQKLEEHADLVKYLDLMRNNVLRNNGYNERYVSEAFDFKMMNQCRSWATDLNEQEESKGNKDEFYGIVFFDFDRVLNCVEGISILHTKEQMKSQYDIDVSGVVKYIIGSPTRLSQLRELLGYLEFKKIRVCILTNNGACGDREMFYDVCEGIHSCIKRENIFCCRKNSSKLECLYVNKIISSPYDNSPTTNATTNATTDESNELYDDSPTQTTNATTTNVTTNESDERRNRILAMMEDFKNKRRLSTKKRPASQEEEEEDLEDKKRRL